MCEGLFSNHNILRLTDAFINPLYLQRCEIPTRALSDFRHMRDQPTPNGAHAYVIAFRELGGRGVEAVDAFGILISLVHEFLPTPAN